MDIWFIFIIILSIGSGFLALIKVSKLKRTVAKLQEDIDKLKNG